jgi:hypothetical protein
MWSLVKLLNPNNLLSLFDNVVSDSPTTDTLRATTSTVAAEAPASSSGLLSILGSGLYYAVTSALVIGAAGFALALVKGYLNKRREEQEDDEDSEEDEYYEYQTYRPEMVFSASRSLEPHHENYYGAYQTHFAQKSRHNYERNDLAYESPTTTDIAPATQEQIYADIQAQQALAQAQAAYIQRQALTIAFNEYMQQRAATNLALMQAREEQAIREQALIAQHSYATVMELDYNPNTDMDCSEVTYETLKLN